MISALTKFNTALPRNQRGVSLVELMVALVIGLLVVAAVTSLTISTSRTNTELSRLSRQVENGRYALQLLNDELRHAGFYGRLHDLGVRPSSLPDPCSVAQTDLESGITMPVQAHTSDTGLTCLDDVDHLDNTEILVIRRAATEPTIGFNDVPTDSSGSACDITALNADDMLTQGHIYIQPQPKRFIVGVAPELDVLTTFSLMERDQANGRSDCPTPIHRSRTDIYYLSPTTTPSSACPGTMTGSTENVPTLMRLRHDLTGSWCSEPLVEGIQNLQYDFGIDNNGDGVTDQSVRIPADTAEWSNVVTVRINLLARNHESSVGFTDEKTYSMSQDGTLVLGPFGDDVRRRLFIGLVRLTNPAGRREGN